MAMHRRGGFDNTHRLNLTDDQKKQMKAANDDYHKQLAALQGNDKISLGDYKTQLAALHKSHREQVSSILTDDQKKMMADGRKRFSGRMHNANAANLDKMKQNLGLSDDQVAKIKTQREQLHTQLQSLHSDSTLLPAQKKEKVKELFAAQKEEIKSVLTADQYAKLQSLQKQRINRMRRIDGDKLQVK